MVANGDFLPLSCLAQVLAGSFQEEEQCLLLATIVSIIRGSWVAFFFFNSMLERNQINNSKKKIFNERFLDYLASEMGCHSKGKSQQPLPKPKSPSFLQENIY